MNKLVDPATATDNLLQNCAGLTPRSSLLIVYEDPKLGWYDQMVTETIVDAARSMGIKTQTFAVGTPQNEPNIALTSAMQQYDCTLFLSRIGDQDRFASPVPGKAIVMCYLRSFDMLTSNFAGVSYQATQALKKVLDSLACQASKIEIFCPLGTKCSLEQTPHTAIDAHDVSILRFPLGVITPIDARKLSGRVVLSHFLTPTGSRVYHPPNLELRESLVANIENGRISGFEGNIKDVAAVENHYRRIAAQFDIDPSCVHSWHAGMHPGLSYLQKAESDPDRWSNTIFNHPRILHFHTCGAYAPGEICWIVKDQTILLDGKPLWDEGKLCLQDFSETRTTLENWPELERLFYQAAGQIGL